MVEGAFILDEKNSRQFYKDIEMNIGRYPHGFRHYESFVNYKYVNPDATIHDYMNEMNRQVEFDEFLSIMRASNA
jgi:hypothetical protein